MTAQICVQISVVSGGGNYLHLEPFFNFLLSASLFDHCIPQTYVALAAGKYS